MDRIYGSPDDGGRGRCHRRVRRIGKAHGPPRACDRLIDTGIDETRQPVAVRICCCIADRTRFDAVAVTHRRDGLSQRDSEAQRVVVRAGAGVTEPRRQSFR
jgi:hypothetical protein